MKKRKVRRRSHLRGIKLCGGWGEGDKSGEKRGGGGFSLSAVPTTLVEDPHGCVGPYAFLSARIG